MNNTIEYLNTDLDLICPEDLTELGCFFEANRCSPIHVTRGDDGLWYATFETDEPYREPELSIAQLLTVVECLSGSLRSQWMACTRREFNIGYDCGDQHGRSTRGYPYACSVE